MMAATEREFRVPRGGEKLPVGVWDLICWAFRRECVSLDFQEERTGMEEGPKAWDTIAKMMAQGELGCRVDGGGRSEPHHDAVIVAGALTVLGESLGGKRSAIWVSDLARTGSCPDYGQSPEVLPVAYTENQHGRRPLVVRSWELGSEGWPKTYRTNRKGRQVEERIDCCPVEIRPNAAELARMRRSYHHWWTILLELKTQLQISHLTSFTVTDDMPPVRPWAKTG